MENHDFGKTRSIPLGIGLGKMHSQTNRKPDATKLLTAREIELIGCLQKGLGNKWIAHEMAITENTVESNLKNIYRKLNVNSRTEAVMKYLSTNEIDQIMPKGDRALH
jgi:DNA-binding NarL/FixJ family response regulator